MLGSIIRLLSCTILAVTLPLTACTKTLRPLAPTGLIATPGSTNVTLSWSASSGATSYIVKRGTVSGTHDTTFTLGNVLTYNDIGLSVGTRYYYVVTATNAGGTSPYSPERSATVGHVARTNNNDAMTNVVYTLDLTSDTTHGKQMFLHNMARLDSISVLLEGWGANTSDVLTLKIGTACSGGTGWQYWGTVNVDLAEQTSPYWYQVTLVEPMNLTHGEYYIIEASTQVSKLGVNRNVYQAGRYVYPTDARNPQKYNMGNYTSFTPTTDFSKYGQKKQDLMFKASGYADPASSASPMPTTNMACPSSCILVHSTENAPIGSPANAFNVMIREINGLSDGSFRPGSFPTDDMAALKTAIITNMLEGSGGLSVTYPFADLYNQHKMNFYIAREHPSNDPEYMRGFMHCANIDAVIDINTGVLKGSFAATGGFHGRHYDPRNGDMSVTMMHEVFGHGFSTQHEYICDGNDATCVAGELPFYTLNVAPLGSGTNACADPASANWCTSSKSVVDLKGMMNAAGDSVACWTLNASDCAGNSRCHNISSLSIPYFSTYACVPKNVVNYNIGVGCQPVSIYDGCYIGMANSFTDVSLHVATPNSAIMQTNRSHNTFDYSSTRQLIKKLLDCAFDTTNCATYDQAACDAFQDNWDGGTGGNANNMNFLTNANACAYGVSKRR